MCRQTQTVAAGRKQVLRRTSLLQCSPVESPLSHCTRGRSVAITMSQLALVALILGCIIQCQQLQTGIPGCHAAGVCSLNQDVVSIAAGSDFTCAVLYSGAVKCWGEGVYGKLGQGSTDNLGDEIGEMEALEPVNLNASAIGIATGRDHACAVLEDGSVKCWGWGQYGQLGHGNTTSLGDEPGEMAALKPVSLGARAISVAAGEAHTCALLDNGKVKCWGRGFEFRLGQGGGGHLSSIGDAPGEMEALPPLDLGANALAVDVGDAHSCALLEGGLVKCWGRGTEGQLGQDSGRSIGSEPGELAVLRPVNLGAKAVGIATGSYHSCALLENGSVKCWGEGQRGQLGQGSTHDIGDWPGSMAALMPIDLGARCVALAAGGYFTCALLINRSVKCWGQEQLGPGFPGSIGDEPGEMAALAPITMGDGVRALAAGSWHSCAVLDVGVVKCWGSGREGQLGIGIGISVGDKFADLTSALPVSLRPKRTAARLSAGAYHACVVLDSTTGPGSVKCWGEGDFGRLGQGSISALGDEPGEMTDLLPIDLRASATLAVAGVYHTCAVLDDGSLKCWGWGQYGQLGQGSRTTWGNQPGQMAALEPFTLGAKCVSVALGETHTCALLDGGSVKCWGGATHGQLGEDSASTLGDDPGEMAALLPINLGANAVAIAAGSHHTCALLVGGLVKCWGKGTNGQLGQDSTSTLGDQPGEMAALTPVRLNSSAIGIAAGSEHSCALLDGGLVQCWGLGSDGRLGQDSTSTLGDEPGEMAALKPINLGASAIAIAAGGSHTCALLDGGSIKCWGSGAHGELGTDSTESLGDEPGEMASLAGIRIGASVAIAAGRLYTCALLEDGTVKCWGWGGSGQLGQDSIATVGDSPGEMTALRAVDLGAGPYCHAGSYGMTDRCTVCPPGAYCPNAATTFHACPARSVVFNPSIVGMTSEEQCTSAVLSSCAAGHLCPSCSTNLGNDPVPVELVVDLSVITIPAAGSKDLDVDILYVGNFTQIEWELTSTPPWLFLPSGAAIGGTLLNGSRFEARFALKVNASAMGEVHGNMTFTLSQSIDPSALTVQDVPITLNIIAPPSDAVIGSISAAAAIFVISIVLAARFGGNHRVVAGIRACLTTPWVHTTLLLCMEVLDVVTDGWATLSFWALAPGDELYFLRSAYMAFFIVSLLVSAVLIFLSVRLVYLQVRAKPKGGSRSSRWFSDPEHVGKDLKHATAAAFLLEDVPFLGLSLAVFAVSAAPIEVIVSTVVSMIMLGVKLRAVDEVLCTGVPPDESTSADVAESLGHAMRIAGNIDP